MLLKKQNKEIKDLSIQKNKSIYENEQNFNLTNITTIYESNQILNIFNLKDNRLIILYYNEIIEIYNIKTFEKLSYINFPSEFKNIYFNKENNNKVYNKLNNIYQMKNNNLLFTVGEKLPIMKLNKNNKLEIIDIYISNKGKGKSLKSIELNNENICYVQENGIGIWIKNNNNNINNNKYIENNFIEVDKKIDNLIEIKNKNKIAYFCELSISIYIYDLEKNQLIKKFEILDFFRKMLLLNDNHLLLLGGEKIHVINIDKNICINEIKNCYYKNVIKYKKNMILCGNENQIVLYKFNENFCLEKIYSKNILCFGNDIYVLLNNLIITSGCEFNKYFIDYKNKDGNKIKSSYYFYIKVWNFDCLDN